MIQMKTQVLNLRMLKTQVSMRYLILKNKIKLYEIFFIIFSTNQIKSVIKNR
jgi:hypothetical protein